MATPVTPISIKLDMMVEDLLGEVLDVLNTQVV
jgi:hypothetical protein